MSQAPLFREDVLFGRAILAFRIASRAALAACVEEQHRLAAAGRRATLAEVALARRVLTVEQYRRLVEEVRKRFSAPNMGAATAAALAIPEITASGKYTAVPAGQEALGESPLALDGPSEMAPARRPTTRRHPLPADAPPAAPPAWGAPKPEPQRITPTPLPPSPPGAPDPFSLDPAAVADAVASFARHAEEVVAPNAELDVLSSSRSPGDGDSKRSQDKWKEQLAGTARADQGIRDRLGIAPDAETFDFGPFRKVRLIGSGATGVVYKSRGPDGRVLAIKVLANIEASERTLKRFMLEARASRSLDHPGIVRVHDVGVLEEIPYFAMDFVEGRELREILKVERPGRDALLALLKRVADAVAYAHDHGIVHRDLKPANIMVRASDGAPLLTDFGLAKDLNANLNLTAVGTVLGTPLYSAPELHQDATRATPRSDVYSLGVMLYEMACGKVPFMATSPAELFHRVANEQPKPPSKIDPTSPWVLDAICARALEKDPVRRYPEVRSFLADLDRALHSGIAEPGEETFVLLGKIAEKLRPKDG